VSFGHARLCVDGLEQASLAVPLVDDHAEHRVDVQAGVAE